MKNLSAIYSETYNFVYLRAKSIMYREEDVQQIVKEVYMKAADEDVREDRLYQWLGRNTYFLGCAKFRKKRVSEAEGIELNEGEYRAASDVDLEETKKVICDTLEDLPDMYQATLYAFYHDQMPIKHIATVMGYHEKAILYRLDYAHKYLTRVLANYEEENNIGTRFSVEALVGALEEWSEKNRMSDTVAQNLYGVICREIGVQTDDIETEDNVAGADKTFAENEEGVFSFVQEEFSHYRIKQKSAVKPLVIMIAVLAVGILALALVFVFGMKDKEKKPDKTPQQQENVNPTPEDVEEEEEEEEVDASEYIFPNSSTVRLTRDDLQGLSKEQLRLARNEIYARYGVKFGPEDLQEYFGSKSWYIPKMTFDEFDENVTISDVEGANITLIVNMEAELD